MSYVRKEIHFRNQQFGMGTVKSFITQPTQRVISKNFAMGVVKTAIIAPINAAISSNVRHGYCARAEEPASRATTAAKGQTPPAAGGEASVRG